MYSVDNRLVLVLRDSREGHSGQTAAGVTTGVAQPAELCLAAGMHCENLTAC
jgi:hypothetical protein